jgi:hypothetical protein
MALHDRGEDGRDDGRGDRDRDRARRHSPFDDEIAAFIDDLLFGRGREFLEAARGHAADYAQRRKGDAARSVADIARSLRASGHAFDDRPHIRDFVDAAALGLENLADDIRNRSFREMYGEVEHFARRRPLLVAAAAGLAGFAIARWLTRPRPHVASSRPPSSRPPPDDFADVHEWRERREWQEKHERRNPDDRA